jgi:hypothetical protein
MRAERLLRLYPRAWRERYGEEFLEFVGPGRLRPQQVIDIVSGAIDAHLSREVRRSTAPSGEGAIMLTALKVACAQTSPRITRRDGLFGAAAMILGTIAIVAAGTWAKRQGWADVSEVILSLAFPASLLFAMPFLWLKGHSLKAQALLVGGPLLILVAFGYVATRL